MNKAILILALIGFATAFQSDSFSNLWSAWKIQHKKTYPTSEHELARFSIFVENYLKINRLNEENDSVKFGLNKFADLTAHEFKYNYASGAFPSNQKFLASNSISFPVGNLPDSVDWRNKGAVTPVKDQNSCGADWAFSITGLLEGVYFINNGKLLSFSEQQILDCDTKNMGCYGGYPHLAIKYAAKNGLETEADYPFNHADNQCTYKAEKAVPLNPFPVAHPIDGTCCKLQ